MPPSIFEFILQLACPAILKSQQDNKELKGSSDEEGETPVKEPSTDPSFLYVMEYCPYSGVCTACIISQGLLPISLKHEGCDPVPVKHITSILQDFVPEADIRYYLKTMLGEDLSKPDLQVLTKSLPRPLHGSKSREHISAFSQTPSQNQTPISGHGPLILSPFSQSPSQSQTPISGHSPSRSNPEKEHSIRTPGRDASPRTPNKRTPPRHFGKKSQSQKKRRKTTTQSEYSDSEEDQEKSRESHSE